LVSAWRSSRAPINGAPETVTSTREKSKSGLPSTTTLTTRAPLSLTNTGSSGSGGGGSSGVGGGGCVSSRRRSRYSKQSGRPARSVISNLSISTSPISVADTMSEANTTGSPAR
jgi:hypothetical protein